MGFLFPSLLLQLKEVQTEHDAVTFVNLISLIIGQITFYLSKPAQALLFIYFFNNGALTERTQTH